MKSYFEDPDSRSWALPEAHAEDDVRLSEDVLERYISLFTEAKDLVFDPFAGYGTTLLVAERMGRIGLGCEILLDRADYANSLLSTSEVIAGDIRKIDLSGVTAQLIISSPPYMNRFDSEDPLQGYSEPVASYEQYVIELASIYVDLVGKILAPGGRLVIQLQNLRNEQGETPLAFDLFAAIDRRLKFMGEEVAIWQKPSYGYSHGHCFIYTSA